LKVALMSGYVDPKIFDRMRIDWNQLLVKPFTGERLLRKVRRTLDAP
ncbi:MAG: response regulator, partial [Deltaproteobacteria bacterium]